MPDDHDPRARFRAARERWEQGALARTLAKAPLRKPRFETDAGIVLKDLYGPDDAAVHAGDDAYLREVGFPGEPPFTRGVQSTMYRGRPWTMRQYAGFGTAQESNRRYRYLLQQGQTGLSVAFDLPTQMGRDSDDPLARGEVGRVGVAIDSLEDMRVLLDGLPLDRVSTSMTINATAATLLCLYVAVADERSIPRDKLNGTIQNDILKEYIARGTYIYPPRPSMKLVTDTFAWCAREVPRWNTISISGYHIREAGSDAVQEVAFTLADGLTYVQAALDAGLALADFAPRLAFFFNVHNQFLEEVAKFRAARRLWGRLLGERFGATDPSALALRFHSQTAGSSLTAQQPLVNVVRTTVQALAAVMGGTQSLHCNGYDEALALPTEQSALLALRTQQVLAAESGAADVVDPLGGSYAVEALTDEIEQRARDYLRRIDELGGMVAAIERGWVQGEIERRAYEYQRAIEQRSKIVVGVNEHTIAEPPPSGLLRVDPRLEEEQAARVRALRGRRDARAAEVAQSALGEAARQGTNLLPRILECVKALVTVGEISNALRAVYGEHREVSAA